MMYYAKSFGHLSKLYSATGVYVKACQHLSVVAEGEV